MANKKTSVKVAKLASQTLKKDNVWKNTKSCAWSDLSQSKTNKTTTDKVATKASKVLLDWRTSKKSKSVAWSALSQAKHKNKK